MRTHTHACRPAARSARLALAVALALPLLTLAPPDPATAAATTYLVTDLGALSRAYDLNNAGMVVGSGASSAPPAPDGSRTSHAFAWQGGMATDLGALAGNVSEARAVNATGQVVGDAWIDATARTHAFLYSDGRMADLGTLSGYDEGSANGINARGEVVGTAGHPAFDPLAFRYRGGALEPLPLPTGMRFSSAEDINDAGQIAGWATAQSGGEFNRSIVWDERGPRDLGTLPGGGSSSAEAINDLGWVVGAAVNADRSVHAYLYRDGAMADLGTLPGDRFSSARDVNNWGQVVGSSANVTELGTAFLYSDGAMADLNDLIPPGSPWLLTIAYGINDAGQIIANAFHASGLTSHALLLTPTVPASTRACFPETGRCTHGPFLGHWQSHGGLALNGYPLTDPFVETLEDGKPFLVQYFERVRLEYHPEHPAPHDVQLGQFGRRIHPADPAVAPIPGMAYFQETGHNVPPDFIAFWQVHGGLTQFGFPLSEVFRETLEDGQEYEVQYFERARFERHPENPEPYNVQLGQFGRQVCGETCR